MNVYSYTTPKWRYDELIDSLKPYRAIAEGLHAKGYPLLPLSSIAGWRLRNSIPPAWVPAMISLGLEARVIGRIEDLRRPVKPARRTKRETTNVDRLAENTD